MDKSPDAFRTISEVAELLETPAHVLRFWESRFPQIKPVKRAGGRRYYRPADMALLSGIRKLLHEEGMTIRGVQKILREQGVRHVSGLSEEEDAALEMIEDAEEAVTSSDPIPLFGLARRGAPEEGSAAPADDVPMAAVPVTEDMPDSAAPVVDEVIVAPAEDVLEEQAPPVDAPPVDAPPKAPEQEALEDVAERAAEDLAEEIADAFTDAEVDLSDDTDDAQGAVTYAAPQAQPEDQLASPQAPKNIFVDHPELPFDLPAVTTPARSVDESPAPAETDKDPTAEPTEDVLPVDARELAAEAAQISDAPATAVVTRDAAPVPSPSPAPMPAEEEIPVHWLPADLRALGPDAFVGRLPQASALLLRLEALRNRVGDLGRVPRR